jgi:hypothetical protein
MILYRRFFHSAFGLICGLAVACFVSILLIAAGIDYLAALLTPPLKVVRLRIGALAAKCRHRITHAGGIFVQAVSA